MNMSYLLARPEIQDYPRSVTALQGQNVTFYCNATGVPPPRIKWSFDGGNLSSSLSSSSSSSIVSASTLLLYDLQNTDEYEGTYTCTATNKVGSTNSSSTLTIHG